MKGIQLDPFEGVVREVDVPHERDGYKSIYPFIDCSTFAIVQLDDVNTLFCDDDGLLENPTHFVEWEGYHQPIAGKCLILGTDAEGETIATTMTVEQVRTNVKFTQRTLRGFIPIEGKINHPILGETFVTGHRPDFTPPKREATEDDLRMISDITKRAMKLVAEHGGNWDRDTIAASLLLCHTEVEPLRLDLLLAADDGNFAHDVFEITRELDPTTKSLGNCFSPRFALCYHPLN